MGSPMGPTKLHKNKKKPKKKQGRIHGRRCVRLCYLVNSGGAFVRMCVYVRERVCVCDCACVCVRVCVAIRRLCGFANSLISAARLCVWVCVSVRACVCVCFAIRRHCGSANSFRLHNG